MEAFLFFFLKHMFCLIYKENILQYLPPCSHLACPLHLFSTVGFQSASFEFERLLNFSDFYSFFFRKKSYDCHKIMSKDDPG